MELNLQFERIQDNRELNDIKGDRQNRDDILNSEKNYLLEKEARKQFRKWDNVKYTNESITKKMGGQSMLLMLKIRLIFTRKLMKKQNLDRIEIKYLSKKDRKAFPCMGSPCL